MANAIKSLLVGASSPRRSAEKVPRFLVDEEAQERKLADPTTKEKLLRLDTNVGPMNKYILQFRYVAEAYSLVEQAFVVCLRSSTQRNLKDRMRRKCEVTGIQKILEYLGFPPFNVEELAEIFGKDVSSEGDNITFKRLLVGTGECYFETEGMQYNNPDATTKARWERVTKGFDIVKNMFDLIDKDSSGEITLEEFSDVFISICRDEAIVQTRMGELDYNKDQEITFREFIYGIGAWVGFSDELFYDEDDADLDKSPDASAAEAALKSGNTPEYGALKGGNTEQLENDLLGGLGGKAGDPTTKDDTQMASKATEP